MCLGRGNTHLLYLETVSRCQPGTKPNVGIFVKEGGAGAGPGKKRPSPRRKIGGAEPKRIHYSDSFVQHLRNASSDPGKRPMQEKNTNFGGSSGTREKSRHRHQVPTFCAELDLFLRAEGPITGGKED